MILCFPTPRFSLSLAKCSSRSRLASSRSRFVHFVSSGRERSLTISRSFSSITARYSTESLQYAVYPLTRLAPSHPLSTSLTRCVLPLSSRSCTRLTFFLVLSQMAWADVKKEMTEEKGLDGEVADRIGEYVKLKGESSLSSLHDSCSHSRVTQVDRSSSID